MGARENIAKLPDMCAAYKLEDGSPIFLHVGMMGYHPAPPGLDVPAFNERHGVTRAQVNAMMIGSCFGWEVPGADADSTSCTDTNNDPYHVGEIAAAHRRSV